MIKVILIILNILAFMLYGVDKFRAVRHKWRISEAALLGIAAIGGSAGALLGMYAFHHKTRKNRFRIGVPLMLIAQVILVVMFRQLI